jgi:4'-phosphopantetheinyl transferase
VWLASLDLGAEAVERLARLLSDEDQERAARFHFRRDAIRFVVSRAALRMILGECLGVEPREVGFSYDPRGKPELAVPFDRAGLRFNVSHSASLGLYAVTGQRRVGVDIERLRALPDLEAIAERTFSLHERQALRQLPPAQRHEGFFNCWTRKEAYVKAIGEGLSHPLERFTVSLAPGASARLEHVEGDPGEAGRWTLEALAPDPGYAAAIAIEGQPSRLICLTWQEYAGLPDPEWVNWA